MDDLWLGLSMHTYSHSVGQSVSYNEDPLITINAVKHLAVGLNFRNVILALDTANFLFLLVS